MHGFLRHTLARTTQLPWGPHARARTQQYDQHSSTRSSPVNTSKFVSFFCDTRSLFHSLFAYEDILELYIAGPRTFSTDFGLVIVSCKCSTRLNVFSTSGCLQLLRPRPTVAILATNSS